LPYPTKDRSIVTGSDKLIVGAPVRVTGHDEAVFSKTVYPALQRSRASA